MLFIDRSVTYQINLTFLALYFPPERMVFLSY